MTWQELHVHCNKSQADIVEAYLLSADALSISITDAGDQPLFEPLPNQSPLWDKLIITALFAEDIDLSDLESLLQNCLPDINVHTGKLADQAWERVWMDNYTPIECDNDLWIVPKWMEAPNKAATNVLMDPGLAFGTGYHATTRLCLDWLSQQDLSDLTVLDYGSGSGILAISSLIMGANAAYAVDIDPQAVHASTQNAQLNQVQDRLWSGLPEAFDQLEYSPVDLVTANILAKPLISLAPLLGAATKQGGQIILSGLIASQIKEVKAAYNTWFKFDEVSRSLDSDNNHWQLLVATRQ